jgi:hypothetical protein
VLQRRIPMDVISPETATLGIWTIARFAALAVVATEALFLFLRRRDNSPQGPSRVFWALTPAVLLAGLCFWCSNFVVAARRPPSPVVAQLAR